MQISNIQEIIKQSIFKCVEKSNNEIKVGEDLRRAIPDKCQKAAVNLGIKYENPVYMIYDNTTFKSLKSGFAICSDGIYIASDIGEHLYIPWETILNVQIVVNGGFIFFEGAKLAVNSQNAMCFYKLFDDISYEIKEHGSGAKAVAENVVEESVTEKVIEEVSIIEEKVKETVEETAEESVEEESLIEEVQAEELEIASVEEQDKIETVIESINEILTEEKIELEVEEAKVEETMVEEQPEKPVEEEPKVASGSICKNCGKELSSIAKFCNRCGTKVEISEIKIEPIIEEAKPLEKICTNCNTVNSETAKFCKRCGTKLKD